ncbi:hypothetical protein F3Y22_tig00109980pilonHSYRG00045 [Hibiscus syriacus]|uniref:Protein kinase domain-containing protein n=1 Tax=Hibiscus syriacus TaxID=106335 RepID=A0A6A3BST4_HIBSY|nr:hypothetical protein F3Y22_tig00109980pilonHSYRG00045 [Hibiscus syriacus]
MQGRFGAVYKGTLAGGDLIAVTRLSTGSAQRDLEFENEVRLMANLQHRNLVRLQGFYLEGTKTLVIYEFVSNGSLDKILFGTIYHKRTMVSLVLIFTSDSTTLPIPSEPAFVIHGETRSAMQRSEDLNSGELSITEMDPR